MFRTDMDRQIEKLEIVVKTASDRAIPFAVKDAINATARTGMQAAKREVADRFTIRNTHAKNSISFQQTKSIDIDRMESQFGTTAEYMAKQESGFVNVGKKTGVWIPTPEAANQGGMTRTKPVMRGRRKANINLRKKPRKRWKTEGQQRIAEIIDVFRNRPASQRFWYGILRGNEGLWLLRGGRKTKKGGWPEGMKPRLIYTTGIASTTVPKTEWMEPAGNKAISTLKDEYHKALTRQLNRLYKSGRI